MGVWRLNGVAWATPAAQLLEIYFAAYEAAVDVLSDAHVRPSGETCCVPHVVMFVPSHTQDAHM